MDNKYLFIIAGATAVGKTDLAVEIARHFDTEILSCDSRQFFKEMNIGTAKASETILNSVPHHFINSLSIHDSYSVGDYERDALQLLDQLFEKKQSVIMTGGSGLYIQAVCKGLDVFPTVPEEVKIQIENDFQQNGIQALQKELSVLDPEYYAQVDRRNPHRLMRAIAVSRVSGRPFSSFQNQEKKKRDFKVIYVLLERNREELYERINQRVEEMLAMGLEKEVRSLLPYQKLTSLQTVGYQEFFSYFNGETDYKEAVRLIKRNTRRYAKRQMTWFRRSADWKVFKPNDLEKIITFLEERIK